YAYDSAGNMVARTDALGFVYQYTYDAQGNLLSETDPLAHTTSYIYDGMDRPVQTTNPALDTMTQTYDGNGNVIQLMDYNGTVTSYAYDARHRLTQSTDGLGHTVQYTYDGNNNLITRRNENGFVTTYQYDGRDNLTQVTQPNGSTTSMTFDGDGKLSTQTDPNGHSTTYEYDALDRRTRVTDANGGITEYEYGNPGGGGCCGANSLNLVTRLTDGNGKVTYYEYDSLYRLVTEVRKEGDVSSTPDASDAITTFTYDDHGNRLSMTDPAGIATTYTYDALNRLSTLANGAGDTTVYMYDGDGNTDTVLAPNGNVATYIYDSRNNLVTVLDSGGTVATMTYDGMGNLLTHANGSGQTTTFSYDDRYQITEVTDSLAQTTTYTYDPVGNQTSIVDRHGHTTTYAYDSVNRRVSETDDLGHLTAYSYDPTGNLISITDANGHATIYTYDSVNRRIRETYADANTREYVYDNTGHMTSKTDQLGQTTTYVYNDLYHLTMRDTPVSADDVYTYDLAGRMLSGERAGWIVTFAYDAAGRVAQTDQDSETIEYDYNIPGRTRTITYPSGREITYRTDERDRLDSVEDPLSLTPIADYEYDAADRTISRTSRNGTLTTYTYDANGLVETLDHTIGLTRIAGYTYDYDLEGNALTKEDLRAATQSEAYQYDSVNRLGAHQRGTLAGGVIPAPSEERVYDLDPVGNWNSVDDGIVVQTRTHGVVNQIATIDADSITHNANGNLTEDPLYTYAYDEDNRLIQVTRTIDAQVVGQYQYDALGRRVIKVANPDGTPVETRYFYDDLRVVEEQDELGAVKATYTYGRYVDEPLTMDRAGQTSYYHQNATWSVVALTDAAGAPVELYRYDPYGCPDATDGSDVAVPANAWGTAHSASGNPYLYTGREYDEETGLYHYRARAYDCEKGRFLQWDSLGFVDGPNLYEYAKSNPIKYVDANGQYSVSIPATKGKNQVTKAEFRWLIKRLDWSRWGVWGGQNYSGLPEVSLWTYPGTLEAGEKAWANIGIRGDVDPNNPKKFESVQLTPFVSGGTSGGSSWLNSNYNWTVQKTNVKSQAVAGANGEECHIMTGNVSFVDGNAKTISSSFSITGQGSIGGDKGAPGAEVSAGFTYSETIEVNVTRTQYAGSFKQKICACGAANSDLFDFRKFGDRLDRFGNSYPWYHEIELRVENSEQAMPLNKAGMW
ncbi:MAG: hypothetical protein IT364_18870, partial [Candidatus Hydrogenedentes bacterium]|nr:hypothetical protein [Candidatus Hydrogenedentota bacterium]